MSKTNKTTGELLKEALLSKEEAPYKIPENWIWIELNDILNSLSYGILKPGDEDLEGIPMIRVLDIDYGKFRDTQLFKVSPELHKEYRRTETEVGDILLAVMATIGRAVVVDEEHSGFNVNRALAVLKLNDKVISQFVCNLILSPYFQKIFVEKKLGSAQSRINLKDLRTFKIPLPPLNEQKRIVEKLDILLNKVDEVKQLIEEARETFELRRAAILDKAFRGELTAQWRTKNVDCEPADVLLEMVKLEKEKNNNIRKVKGLKEAEDVESPFNIPESWKWVTLHQICSDIADIDHKMPKAVEDGIKFLSAKDLLDDGTLNFTENIKLISREDFERLSRKIKPKRGDIIYSRIGAKLGKSRIVETDEEFLVSYSCCVIRPLVVDVKYLNNFLDSGFVLKQALSHTKSIGVPDLGMGDIKNFMIPVPPIAEQKYISMQIIKLFEREKEVYQIIKQLETDLNIIKQSILLKAFRGELGTNDPSEESAIELLKEVLQEQVK